MFSENVYPWIRCYKPILMLFTVDSTQSGQLKVKVNIIPKNQVAVNMQCNNNSLSLKVGHWGT